MQRHLTGTSACFALTTTRNWKLLTITWKKRMLLGLGCFIAIALVSGAVFEAVTRQQERQFQSAWKELHDDEVTWSSHSRHEILTDSDHYIQFDRPDVVIKAIVEVVGDVNKYNLEGKH